MTLGERICQFRTAKNLSQGDLAEALDVSRQSVSKWETDTSVPELDKLVKLCDLFNVSLDELVRGMEVSGEGADAAGADRRKTYTNVGGVLLIAGFFAFFVLFVKAGLIAAVLFSLPLLGCGLICFLIKQNTLTWIKWYLVAWLILFAFM